MWQRHFKYFYHHINYYEVTNELQNIKKVIKMKKKLFIIGVVIALFLVLSLSIISLQKQNLVGSIISNQEGKVKIGAIYPLTGSNSLSLMGNEYKRGLEMATEEINSQGGINGKQIELIFEDGQNDAVKSLNAYNKLVELDGVDFVFTAFSGPASTLAPIAEEKGKILIYSSTISLGNGGYVFKDYWNMDKQAKLIAETIKEKDHKRIAILAMKHPSTPAYINTLKRELKNQKIEFVQEDFELGTKDFASILTKLNKNNPDAIITYVLPGADAELILKTIKQIGMDSIQLYAGTAAFTNLRFSGKYADILDNMNAIDTWYGVAFNSEKARFFKSKYQSRYKQNLLGDAVYAYDDLFALVIACENANSINSENVRLELLKINYLGVAGPLSFDKKGNSQRIANLVIFNKNQWEYFKTNIDT